MSDDGIDLDWQAMATAAANQPSEVWAVDADQVLRTAAHIARLTRERDAATQANGLFHYALIELRTDGFGLPRDSTEDLLELAQRIRVERDECKALLSQAAGWIEQLRAIYDGADQSDKLHQKVASGLQDERDLLLRERDAAVAECERLKAAASVTAECICPLCGLRHGGSRGDGGF